MKAYALALAAAVAVVTVGVAQQWPTRRPIERVGPDVLDVVAPSALVRGEPGAMSIRGATCRDLPLDRVRRRIVDVAAQEWGFFGLSIVDRTQIERPARTEVAGRRRWSRLSPEESARVAPSIAGFWTVTPQGPWIIAAQNEAWRGRRGIGARWRYPWSAAFISWVMCEAGVGDSGRFRGSRLAHGRRPAPRGRRSAALLTIRAWPGTAPADQAACAAGSLFDQ